MQLDVPFEAVEIINASETSKNKEHRRKRKQEVLEMTVEAAPTEESPDKSISKRKKRSYKDSKPNSAHSCVGDNVSKVIVEPNFSSVNLDLFISFQEYLLIPKQFSYQSIEHSNADTSQQAQLPTIDLLAASPIAEEEAGVESSPPLLNLEVTSPNQHPGDSSLDAHTDQHIVVGKYNVSLGNTSNPGDNSSKDATPMVKIQTTNVALSQEELDQLEKDNPWKPLTLW